MEKERVERHRTTSRAVFRVAAIYGFLVLLPQYFMERLGFGALDLVLGALFFVAWLRLR